MARAGLSNNVFYRHFRSKDDLVLAILDDGRRTLSGYLEHLMATGAHRRGQGPALDRGDDDAGRRPRYGRGDRRGHVNATRPTAVSARRAVAPKTICARSSTALVHTASVDPQRDAHVIFHAVVGTMTDYLVRQQKPSARDVKHLAAFCVAGIGVANGT